MPPSTATRKNGKMLTTPACKHAPNCELAQGQGDLKAQLQNLSETVGMAFERLDERLDMVVGRVEMVHTEHLDRTKDFLDTNEHILKLLRKVVPT
jgi:hypothetical protein